MKPTTVLIAVTVAGACALLTAQGPLNPALLTKPATDSWPTYNGDYSGQHYSTLKQITAENAHGLSMAWIFHTPTTDDGLPSR